MTGIRRILVAVDASPLSLAAAMAAAGLARRLEAEIEALFIEDINVVRLAAHPHVHTFSIVAARRQAIDPAMIERSLRLQATKARHAATEAGATLAVRRGKVEAELLAAAESADLICLGWSSHPAPGRRPRLGSVARRLAEAASKPVMVMREQAVTGPVCVLANAGERVLRVAEALADGRPVRTVADWKAAPPGGVLVADEVPLQEVACSVLLVR